MVAVFWGVTPNLFSFEMLLVIQIITFEFSVGRSGLDTFPTWVFINYDISHSLFSAVIVITMVWFLNRSFAFAMLGWPFHVFFDFPSISIHLPRIYMELIDWCRLDLISAVLQSQQNATGWPWGLG